MDDGDDLAGSGNGRLRGFLRRSSIVTVALDNKKSGLRYCYQYMWTMYGQLNFLPWCAILLQSGTSKQKTQKKTLSIQLQTQQEGNLSRLIESSVVNSTTAKTTTAL